MNETARIVTGALDREPIARDLWHVRHLPPPHLRLGRVDRGGAVNNDVRILVSVCRKQPLCVEGVDPEGAYEVEVEGRPVQNFGVRTVRTIQARLAKKTEAAVAPTRRTYTPGTTRFLDLEVEGEEKNFVERTICIRKIAEPRASAVKAELIAAIPAKRGRVT